VKSIIRINSSKNQMNISSRQLDAFIALAQLGSFTLAAQRCLLSQPAFSALI
jgi:DNA-binding transcriptional LysR family regulator